MYKKTKHGFALIEVLIAITIISGCIIVIFGLANQSLIYSETVIKEYQASLATEEAIEAVKAIRSESWSTNIASLINNTNYGINFGATNWQINPNPQTTSLGFTRTIVFSEVYRDASDRIAQSGTLDTGTKKVTITTTWNDRGAARSQSIEFYITNIF
jgi:prepilin-type N-terminal cleavage/methylation domain-containing protein